MIVYFAESAFPSLIIKAKENDLMFLREGKKEFYSKFKCRKISIRSDHLYKLIKFAFLLQPWVKVFTQGGASLGYSISKHKNIFSDGLLTEFLFRNDIIKCKSFIGLESLKKITKRKFGTKKIIIGNNYCDFKLMTTKNYMKYLKKLKKDYGDYEYWLHPAENETLAKKVFSEKCIRNKGTAEDIIEIIGIEKIVIPLASTMAVSMSKYIPGAKITCISLDEGWYDGERGFWIDSKSFNRKSVCEVSVFDLEDVAKSMIPKCVKLRSIDVIAN